MTDWLFHRGIQVALLGSIYATVLWAAWKVWKEDRNRRGD